jgi:hypothetical protein
MGADAIFVIAIGTLLLLGYVVIRATVLCQRALQYGGRVEVEVKAPSLSVRFRAAGHADHARGITYDRGNESQHARSFHETK